MGPWSCLINSNGSSPEFCPVEGINCCVTFRGVIHFYKPKTSGSTCVSVDYNVYPAYISELGEKVFKFLLFSLEWQVSNINLKHSLKIPDPLKSLTFRACSMGRDTRRKPRNRTKKTATRCCEDLFHLAVITIDILNDFYKKASNKKFFYKFIFFRTSSIVFIKISSL